MARKVFYSFHYQLDSWRVAKIKEMGTVEGQPVLSSNEWEDVAKGGDDAIKKWIDENMKGKSCNVVLIGSQTAGREWVEYEFTKAWADGKGVLGIYIHNLTDHNQNTTTKGKNPFSRFTINDGKTAFDSVVPVHNPAGRTSSDVYETIKNNIESWVEEAIAIRKQW